ncbi:MAG TPA: BTAD domain-containing putative transcriptional regulator, partial [Acidimicrobiales bacterium]|nr:BTAD domain-containing putative transcriptional regulator [Acidimicrobiales bacterium]
AGLPGDGWARAERVRLSEARLAATEDRIDADLAIGDHASVVSELERLTAQHPLRERLWGQLMVALYRCGRQADALRAFQQARRHLVDELGIEPGARLRQLEAAVLAQDPALDPPVVVHADGLAITVTAPPDAAGSPVGAPQVDGLAGAGTNGSTGAGVNGSTAVTGNGSNGAGANGSTTAAANGSTAVAGNGSTGAGAIGSTGPGNIGAVGTGNDGDVGDPGEPAAHQVAAGMALPEPRSAGGNGASAPSDATAAASLAGAPTRPADTTDTAHRRGNIPRPLTACLGRDTDQAEVLSLIDTQRLVTLVGPGGAGKTRLAVEVAHALGPSARDGVWLVDLASVRDAASVLGAVVRSLRLDEGILAGAPAPRTVDDVADTLVDRRLVLLVDNCEHVVDDIARLIETLLARCPDLRVLATSRETLGVPGEFLYVVPPLPLDHAVALFVERMGASGVTAPAAFDHGAFQAVTEICRRLDGLPLAVELAAARARHLDLAEMVDRLDQRFDLLTEGPRTAQPRQRTLRAVVDWSYELLDDGEKLVFERLSVFPGGATLAATRAVCADGDGEGGIAEAAVDTVLGRLVDKSLVVLERTPSGARFAMLQTLADYAADRLSERRDRDDITRRYLGWALAETYRASITRPSGGHVDEVRAVQTEAGNLLHAIELALDLDHVLALEMAGNLGWHWFTTMQSGLAWSVLTTALDRADGDAPPAFVARAQALAGLAGVMSGHGKEAFALSDAALEIEREIDDPQRLGWHHFLRASQHVFSVEAESAQRWLDLARDAFGRIGDAHGLATVDYQQGVVAGLLGDLAEARRLLARACEEFRRTDNHMTLMAALARQGEVAERDERLDDSYLAWEELHGLAIAASVPALVALAAAGMTFISYEHGDALAATQYGEAAMEASNEGFAPLIGGYAHAAWGIAQAAFGDRERGVEDIHTAAGLFSRVGYHGGAAECWWRLSRIRAEEGDCGQAVACAEHAVECADKGDDAFARETAQAQLDTVRRLAG